MKKIFPLILAVALALSLVACGGGQGNNESSEAAGLTNEQCIGTWKWSFEDSPDKTNLGGAETLELSDGGVGKGTGPLTSDGSYYPLTWEIEDDILKISFTADPLTGAFYVDGNTMTSTDGGYVYLKVD